MQFSSEVHLFPIRSAAVDLYGTSLSEISAGPFQTIVTEFNIGNRSDNLSHHRSSNTPPARFVRSRPQNDEDGVAELKKIYDVYMFGVVAHYGIPGHKAVDLCRSLSLIEPMSGPPSGINCFGRAFFLRPSRGERPLASLTQEIAWLAIRRRGVYIPFRDNRCVGASC